MSSMDTSNDGSADTHATYGEFFTGSRPAGGYRLAGDIASWQTEPRIVERGYYWPWTSHIGDGNGEDAFIELLGRHLAPDADALELGCGHGELALAVSSRCRSVVGIDRYPDPIGLATELSHERNIVNARFLVHDFQADVPSPPLPLERNSISLVYCRRGPIARRWMSDVLRVAKRGTPIILLHPGGLTPPPEWRHRLPEVFQEKLAPHRVVPFDWAERWVVEPFSAAGILDYSLHWHDVPEWFTSPEGLYGYLAMNVEQAPALSAVADRLQEIIGEYGAEKGLPLRQRRLLAFGRLP